MVAQTSNSIAKRDCIYVSWSRLTVFGFALLIVATVITVLIRNGVIRFTAQAMAAESPQSAIRVVEVPPIPVVCDDGNCELIMDEPAHESPSIGTVIRIRYGTRTMDAVIIGERPEEADDCSDAITKGSACQIASWPIEPDKPAPAPPVPKKRRRQKPAQAPAPKEEAAQTQVALSFE